MMDCIEGGDESEDQLTPLCTDAAIVEQILAAKTGDPSKFASYWEMDENDIEVGRRCEGEREGDMGEKER